MTMTFCLLQNLKESILKNIGNQTTLESTDFHNMDKNKINIITNTHLSENIFTQKKDIHRSLK